MPVKSRKRLFIRQEGSFIVKGIRPNLYVIRYKQFKRKTKKRKQKKISNTFQYNNNDNIQYRKEHTMAEFNVTINQLTSKADELEQLNQTFDSMIKTLQETEAALGAMWEGEAKKGFHTAFSNDMVQLRNFYNAIIAYINALRQAIAKYIEAENKNVETASTRKYQ